MYFSGLGKIIFFSSNIKEIKIQLAAEANRKKKKKKSKTFYLDSFARKEVFWNNLKFLGCVNLGRCCLISWVFYLD